MEVESRKDRIIRIIKTIMFTYGFDSVQKFADDAIRKVLNFVAGDKTEHDLL